MKRMRRRRSQLPVVTLLVVPAALGCVQVGPAAEDQLEIVTDAVETAAQFSANTVLLTGNLGFHMEDAVAKAFLRTAAIKPEFHQTNSNLPEPVNSPDYP